MSKPKTAASPKKGEAAVAASEAADEARPVEWEGKTLTARKPSDIPSTYMFDQLQFEDNPTLLNLLRLVKAMLEPESFVVVRSRFAEIDGDEKATDTALTSLFKSVMGPEPGE